MKSKEELARAILLETVKRSSEWPLVEPDEFNFWCQQSHQVAHALDMNLGIKTPGGSRRKNSIKQTGAYTSEFETFWFAYPRGEKKGAAAVAFDKAKKDCGMPAGWLAKRAQEYAEAKKGVERKFIPHASTWLNGRYYDDDTESWSETGKEENGLSKAQQRENANANAFATLRFAEPVDTTG